MLTNFCSFWDRSREHMQALLDHNQNKDVVKNWEKGHPNSQDPPRFKFEVVSSHTSAISRQLSEGLKIEACDPTTLINGRGEYGSNRIPRMKLTLDDEILGQQNPRHTNDPAMQFSMNNESSLKTKKAISHTCSLQPR